MQKVEFLFRVLEMLHDLFIQIREGRMLEGGERKTRDLEFQIPLTIDFVIFHFAQKLFKQLFQLLWHDGLELTGD